MASLYINAAQLRAARALLDWSREQLAEASRVGLRTVVDFERGARQPRDVTTEALRRALEIAGVEFIAENGGGAGVRLWKPTAVVRETKSGYCLEVALPGHALAHVLKDDFRSERDAEMWAASDEGRAFVNELGKRWWERRPGSS